MINSRNQDLNEFGTLLNEKYKLGIPKQIVDNLSSTLECFAEIKYDQKIIQYFPKPADEKEPKKPPKENAVVKQKAVEAPKPIDKLLKLTSFPDFFTSLDVLREFDLMMCRVGQIRSTALQSELAEIINSEKEIDQSQERKYQKKRPQTQYEDIIKKLTDRESLPEIPKEVQNAIVINLYCIDELFESRSLDFVEYAFSLYPEREYLILTQPFTVQETTLLQNFIQVQRKKNSTFEHVLYIYHKDCLSSHSLVVKKSVQEDIGQISPLLQDLINKEGIIADMKEAITNSMSRKVSFSVYCE